MTKLWMAMIATMIAGGYGMEAMGQGGGNGGFNNADNLGSGTDRDHVRINEIIGHLVIGALSSSGSVNTHGQSVVGSSGGGDDIGNDAGDSLGGNADAGGWGGDKP